MVDSSNIVGGPVSTLLRAQTVAAPAQTAGAQQPQAQILPPQPVARTRGSGSGGGAPFKMIGTPNDNLPRGSIVDILA